MPGIGSQAGGAEMPGTGSQAGGAEKAFVHVTSILSVTEKSADIWGKDER